MKIAGRENLNSWANVSSNRTNGADRQNRPCSILWAVKQENVQSLQTCFFLTSPFIEVVSTGRRNTFLKFTRRSLKT
jgi:hypothetical protein